MEHIGAKENQTQRGAKIKTVEQNLEQALKTFKERNKVYGKNYYKFGKVMKELFPDGVVSMTPFASRSLASNHSTRSLILFGEM